MARLVSYMAGALAAAALIGLGLVFLISEHHLTNAPTPTAFDVPIPTSDEAIAHGRHIARTRGCFGCHGQDLSGREFPEWDWVARAVAPNLTLFAREHDASTIEAAVRHGIGADGRELWSMPAFMSVHLNDDDMAALIAFLRSVELVDNDLPERKLGWQARWEIFTGTEQSMADWAELVPDLRLSEGDDPALRRGEYLAKTTCLECHGLDLRGASKYPPPTPDLAMVGAYSDEQFARLMKEGTAADGREDIGLMTMVAKDRFASFTDQERADLKAYLGSLLDQPKAAHVMWRPTAESD